MPDAGSPLSRKRFSNLADRSAKATSDIAAIIKAPQEVAHEAVSAANEGLRTIDESSVQPRKAPVGLRKILESVNGRPPR